jgi:hypothetical protein
MVLDDILKTVRFPLMSVYDFQQIVKSKGVLNDMEEDAISAYLRTPHEYRYVE